MASGTVEESGETSHFFGKDESMNLSIQEELGVLEKIKDNKQQKWKAERK